MHANFKAPVNRARVKQDICKDPAYIEHINKKAEEDQMMQMYEHSLEPC